MLLRWVLITEREAIPKKSVSQAAKVTRRRMM